MSTSRSSFVLSLTLTELVLLMVFVLLLAATLRIRGADDEAAVAAAETVELQAQLREALQDAQAVQDERAGVDVLLEEIESEGDDFIELVRAAATNIGAAADRDRLIEQERAVHAELDSVWAALQRYENGDGSVADELDRLRAEVETLEGQVGDARGQMLNLQRRVGGLGFPPCWADVDGRPEYIFAIRIEPTLLKVTREWPDHRDAAAGSLNAPAVLGSHMPGRFSEVAQGILDWSQRQDPECRHFVRIEDTSDLTKDDFKSSLLLIEDYFYKYLSR